MTTIFVYDSDGRLLKQTESVTVNDRSQGRSTEYGYDAHGNLTQTKYHDGSTEQWTYDATFDQITSYTDPLGNRTLYTLDTATGLTTAERHVVGQIDSVENGETDDVVTTYTYNTNRKLASVTDALNVVTTYTYNAGGKLASTTISDDTQSAVISRTTYDAWGRTATQTDAAGVLLAYTYDKFDRVTKIARTNDDVVLETRTYDEAGNLKTVKDSLGVVISYTYDSLGNVSQIKSSNNSTTCYTYDKLGRVLTQTDALGNVTSYTYDTWGNLTSTTDVLGSTILYIYNTIGQTISATDALNNVTTYTYDTLGRTTSTTLTSADGTQSTTQSIAYSTQILDGVKYPIVTTTDALNNVSTSTYDLAGRLAKTTAADNSVTTYTYDTESQLLTTTDALNHVTTYTCDFNGNIAATTDTSGKIARYNYNAAAQLLSQTDPLGVTTYYTYNYAGLVTSTTVSDPAITSPGTAWLKTPQTFDGIDDTVNLGNDSALNFEGEITLSACVKTDTTDTYRMILSHGDASAPKAETFLRIKNGYYEVGSYDGTARYFEGEIRDISLWNTALTGLQIATLCEKPTYADAIVTTYTYDAVGRLTSENWLSSGNTALKTFTYTYTYDNLNRNLTTTFTFDTQAAAFAYTYDALGRQTESSLTLNSTQTRANQAIYDFLWCATQIKQTGSTVDEIFAEFEHNANDLLTSVNRYEVDDNDIANSLYTYNANNAITFITHKKPDATPIVQHSYTYDETNNIVEYLNSLDGQTSYDYDFLGQLIGTDYAYTGLIDESYTYNENGNRIGKQNSTHRELYEWDYRRPPIRFPAEKRLNPVHEPLFARFFVRTTQFVEIF